MATTQTKHILRIQDTKTNLESGSGTVILKPTQMAIQQNGTDYRLSFRTLGGDYYETANRADLSLLTLAGLQDVTLTTPTSGQILSYNGTKWVNTAASASYWQIVETNFLEPTGAYGLSIDQGTATTPILKFKNDNVAHGITDVAETDTFGTFSLVNSSTYFGGLSITALTEKDVALALCGVVTSENTSSLARAYGAMTIQLSLALGTGVSGMGGTANLFVIKNYETPVLRVTGGGDLSVYGYFQTSDAATTYPGTYDMVYLSWGGSCACWKEYKTVKIKDSNGTIYRVLALTEYP